MLLLHYCLLPSYVLWMGMKEKGGAQVSVQMHL
jgi:hypothetical protein